jgi:AcrR family transcriptional regulator
MGASSGRVYGGVSGPDRAAERRARLLEAALQLVGTDGAQAATVRAVCAQAGLIPRYFYESFAGRDELVAALLEDVAGQATARVLAAVAAAPDDAPAKVSAAIGAFVDLLDEDPRRARVLFTEGIGGPLTAQRLQLERAFAAVIAAQGREFYGTAPGDDRIVDVTALLLASGLGSLMLAWLQGELPLTRDELVEDVTALFVAAGEAAVGIARRRA